MKTNNVKMENTHPDLIHHHGPGNYLSGMRINSMADFFKPHETKLQRITRKATLAPWPQNKLGKGVGL